MEYYQEIEYFGSVFNPIHLALQRGTPTLWAEVTIDSGSKEKVFPVYMESTGFTIRPMRKHLGTVLMDDGYVGHYYS